MTNWYCTAMMPLLLLRYGQNIFENTLPSRLKKDFFFVTISMYTIHYMVDYAVSSFNWRSHRLRNFVMKCLIFFRWRWCHNELYSFLWGWFYFFVNHSRHQFRWHRHQMSTALIILCIMCNAYTFYGFLIHSGCTHSINSEIKLKLSGHKIGSTTHRVYGRRKK